MRFPKKEKVRCECVPVSFCVNFPFVAVISVLRETDLDSQSRDASARDDQAFLKGVIVALLRFKFLFISLFSLLIMTSAVPDPSEPLANPWFPFFQPYSQRHSIVLVPCISNFGLNHVFLC